MVTLNRSQAYLDGKARDERRKAHAKAAEAAAARDDAALGLSAPAPAREPVTWREKYITAGDLLEMLEAYGEPLGERLRRMDDAIEAVESDVAKTRMALNRKQPGQAEIRDLLARGITDIRNEVRADVVRLTAELEAARREIEALKQAGQGMRMVR